MRAVDLLFIFSNVEVNYPVGVSISIALEVCVARVSVFHHRILFDVATASIFQGKQAGDLSIGCFG
jgi:hypothetical protein